MKQLFYMFLYLLVAIIYCLVLMFFIIIASICFIFWNKEQILDVLEFLEEKLPELI